MHVLTQHTSIDDDVTLTLPPSDHSLPDSQESMAWTQHTDSLSHQSSQVHTLHCSGSVRYVIPQNVHSQYINSQNVNSQNVHVTKRQWSKMSTPKMSVTNCQCKPKYFLMFFDMCDVACCLMLHDAE